MIKKKTFLKHMLIENSNEIRSNRSNNSRFLKKQRELVDPLPGYSSNTLPNSNEIRSNKSNDSRFLKKQCEFKIRFKVEER